MKFALAPWLFGSVMGTLSSIESIDDLTDVQLYFAVWLISGFFGMAGAMLRDEKQYLKAAIIGQAAGVLGILFGSVIEGWFNSAGAATVSVGVAFTLALAGAEGANAIKNHLLSKIRKKTNEED